VSNRIFFYPDFRRYVLFTEDALNHMYAHVQRRCWHKEAGGEIYTVALDNCALIITTATGPNPGDRRGRHSFNPDITATTRHREVQFAHDQHAVGLWHTHPEAQPSPSGQDKKTTEEYLEAFRDDRDRYLMVILGNRGEFPNMAVWSVELSAKGRWVELNEVADMPVSFVR